MADIELATVQRVLEGMFNVRGAGLDRFNGDALTALNRAIGRINRQADLATRISPQTSFDGSIGLDDDYLDVLLDVVGSGLCQMGQRPARGYERLQAIKERELDDRIDDIRQDILNQAVAADTTDATSFAQLGHLG